MKQDAEKHIRIAEGTLLEMEQLMANNDYKGVMSRVYKAMLNAAMAAMKARDIQSAKRQPIGSEFNEAFIKTGLLDEKFYKYFRHAYSWAAGFDEETFASADHRQAQKIILMVKEFIAACRALCD